MLRPMSEEGFSRFMVESVAGYAESKVRSGRWQADGALAKAKAEYERFLPQGVSTPDHYFLDVFCEQSGAVVGHVWWAILERSGVREAFVFDLQIQERHRRQGHARRSLQEVELTVRSLGLPRIGLHVFSYNKGAQALYESLGFGVTSLNMYKEVVSAEASNLSIERTNSNSV